MAVKRDEGVKTDTAGSRVRMMDKRGINARRCVACGVCRLKVPRVKMKASNAENKDTGDQEAVQRGAALRQTNSSVGRN